MFQDANVIELLHVDVAPLTTWVKKIPIDDWPRQSSGVPAMVTDFDWHGFGARTTPLVHELLQIFHEPTAYQRMLSVVLPDHRIELHADRQVPSWICRVHVPLITNPSAYFIVNGARHHLEPGLAYAVNTTELHEVINEGATPRIHLMFDVRGR